MIVAATAQDSDRREDGLHELHHMAQYSRTNLIVNYLPQRLTDDEFRSLFSCVAPVKRAKVCRDKRSGYSFGFGFCEFYRSEDASRAIHTLNGHRLHHKTLKVAYARLQSAESKNCCLHLTNLPAWVAAEDIRRVLAPFGGIISCKILADPQGRPRGIGFCLFETHTAASQAMEAMNQKPWPDTADPPIHIRFAHPNEKKVRAPALHLQQQQQQPKQPQQQQNQQHNGYTPQQQQQQLMQQQQVMCCPEQQQQQQQMLVQPQQMWGCCQQQPMLQYQCPHPLMRATLAYPLPPGPLLLPPPQPPSPPPPAYFEFRVCASNLSPTLDDLQLYGLFAPFGGILEFSVARPEPQAAAAPSESEQLNAESQVEASATAYSSGEDCAGGSGNESDSGGGGGGGGGSGIGTEDNEGGCSEPEEPQPQQLLQQSPEQTMPDEGNESALYENGSSASAMQLMSLTVYVTFNNYQSAAGAVFSLNGQFIHGQQVQVAMRMLEPQQQPLMSESGDLGVAYQ